MAMVGPEGGLQLTAEQADNFEDIEKQFAVKVVTHMETYWSILQSTRGSNLRLTKYDDAILAQFQEEFPEFDVGGVIDEDAMKSKEGKERWRAFISKYEDKIEDFNFGTMVRADAADEYGEKEAIFVVRIQFYAIEIARNRAGLNDWIYEKAHPEAANKKDQSATTDATPSGNETAQKGTEEETVAEKIERLSE